MIYLINLNKTRILTGIISIYCVFKTQGTLYVVYKGDEKIKYKEE